MTPFQRSAINIERENCWTWKRDKGGFEDREQWGKISKWPWPGTAWWPMLNDVLYDNGQSQWCPVIRDIMGHRLSSIATGNQHVRMFIDSSVEMSDLCSVFPVELPSKNARSFVSQ